MTTSENILTAFEEELLADGKGKETVVSYGGDIKGFLHWLQNKNVEFQGTLTRFYITSYKDHLLQENYNINTINKKINSLNSFNMFLIDKKHCTEQVVHPRKDKIKVARGSEAEVEVFSEKEVEQILYYIDNKQKVSHRDSVAILILLYTGLRVSELVNLKVKDMDILSLNLKVIGKGGKYREVPLKTEVIVAVKLYLQGERRTHRQAKSEYLFLSQRSGKLDKDTINKLLKKHGKQLNLVIYPHKFRHTFCTRLLKKGVELTTVSKLAGHSNIQTTASFYINTSREDKQQAVDLL